MILTLPYSSSAASIFTDPSSVNVVRQPNASVGLNTHSVTDPVQDVGRVLSPSLAILPRLPITASKQHALNHAYTCMGPVRVL